MWKGQECKEWVLETNMAHLAVLFRSLGIHSELRTEMVLDCRGPRLPLGNWSCLVFFSSTVSVSWGCHNNMPYTGWLKQQTSIFSQSWRDWEVWDEDASMPRCWWGLSSWLAGGCQTAASSHGLSWEGGRERQRGRENESSLVSLSQRALIPSWVTQPHDLR